MATHNLKEVSQALGDERSDYLEERGASWEGDVPQALMSHYHRGGTVSDLADAAMCLAESLDNVVRSLGGLGAVFSAGLTVGISHTPRSPFTSFHPEDLQGDPDSIEEAIGEQLRRLRSGAPWWPPR